MYELRYSFTPEIDVTQLPLQPARSTKQEDCDKTVMARRAQLCRVAKVSREHSASLLMPLQQLGWPDHHADGDGVDDDEDEDDEDDWGYWTVGRLVFFYIILRVIYLIKFW